MADVVDRFKNFSIEIDCPPGNPRPDDLIASVLSGTGLDEDDFDTSAPFFGHQTWILKEDPAKEAIFKASKPIFKERLEALYHQGVVRYCSW